MKKKREIWQTINHNTSNKKTEFNAKLINTLWIGDAKFTTTAATTTTNSAWFQSDAILIGKF